MRCGPAALAIALLAAAPAAALDPSRPLPLFHLDLYQEELPAYRVHTVHQSRDGYLWLGTFEGLVRFSGAEFRVYDERNASGLTSRRARALVEGVDGTLFVGTIDG